MTHTASDHKDKEFGAGVRFAHRVHELISELEYRGGECQDPSVVALRTLLTALIGSDKCRTCAITAALDDYAGAAKARDAEDERWAAERAERQQWDADRLAETARRYELAVTVECPYCGSQPGKPCCSAGPNGRGYSKGNEVHADRHRAAKGLLDAQAVTP